MKKVLFFALLLMVLGAASVNAQVTIGEDSEPHPGAVLDLKTSKGLLLPRVTLASVNIFQLSEEYADVADGMMVYNNYDATIGGQGKGIYVWDGSKWMFAGISGPVQTPVTSIVVRSQGDITDVMSGSTLQFFADVEPANATNRNVIWSIVPGGSGSGTIDPVSGLFNANSPGTVTVRATALDGSNQYNLKQITVLPATIAVTGISISPQSPPTLTVPAVYDFTAVITPSNATNKTVIWAIVSPAGQTGAAVTQAGRFTAAAPATYKLRASSGADNTIFAEVDVNVNAAPPANSCQGCASFASSTAEATSTYPYYVYHPAPGLCCLTSCLSHITKGCSGQFQCYKWDINRWLKYSTGNNVSPDACAGPR